MLGRVIKFHNSFFFVECEDGRMIPCSLRGLLKRYKRQTIVCAGDFVEIRLLGDGSGVIKRVVDRKNLMVRPAAANVDQIILTFAAREPNLHPLLLNRFLVLAEASDVEHIAICINKIDLISPHTKILDGYERLYNIIKTSARSGQGIEQLRTLVADRVTVFTGPSGVGKSSLLNAIDPLLNQTVGSISDRIRRGKNTTRVSELLKFSGGYLVDTPGFSAVELDDLGVDERNLAHCFPEFKQFAAHCRFNPCSHSHEPDCAVKTAVADHEILAERYESYLSLLKEINERKSKYD
ncbi:MAG: ribosome small subunit-dependent GTPase A [Selenomonadaceae bacterium]|nr:ribosome small subunit-dependent GTPase A [Selenomonadaceae bacterium]